MNRYRRFILILVSAALALFSIVTTAVFSSVIRRQQQESMRRMETVAGYCAAHLAGTISSGGAFPEVVNSWLADVCAISGLERIVIADSLKIVHYSSQALIERGDDLAVYLIDGERFDSALVTGTPRFTASIRIHGTRFKSLYHPVLSLAEPLIIVLEADQHYFAAAQRFGNGIVVSAGALIALLIAVWAGVVAAGRRAEEAEQRARRNEHLAFLGRTSAELAHELKNPLAIIKSSADVLRRKYDPAAGERAFGFLSEEVMRLSRLVTDILAFSREKKLLREPFSPSDVIRSITNGLVAEYPGTVMDDRLAADLVLVGDRDAFCRITDNLMRNAAHAMNGTGVIAVSADIRGASLRMHFSDSGPGIPDDLVSRIFDPFVSGSKTGTGLGLAVVRSLCDAAGWGIELESASAGATRFTLHIPEGMWQRS